MKTANPIQSSMAKNRIRLQTIFLLLLIGCFPAIAYAQDSICAEVKMEIKQDLTLERQAFDAHMRIDNGLTHVFVEDVTVEVIFSDEEGEIVPASSDPDSEGAVFFIRADSENLEENSDGSWRAGSVAPSSASDLHWLIIPSPGAAKGLADGALYFVGAKLGYTIGGEAHTMAVSPDYITVKPMPELELDYFLTKDVFGDDAWTQEIEPPVPFTLGLRIKNSGSGTAKDVRIASAQPRIVENDQGLLVGFVISDCEVDGVKAPQSLLIDFGDLYPGQVSAGRWGMACSLSGKFEAFDAEFSHSDELGGDLTSLIGKVGAHFLVHDVMVDLAGRDGVADFLATGENGLAVYESEGADAPVVDQSANASLNPANPAGQTGSSTVWTLSIPDTPDFLFVRVPDPHAGGKGQVGAIRSDGKVIKPENIWLSKTRNEDHSWNYFLNLFDINTTGSYTIVLDEPASMPQSPVIQFLSDKSGAEGQSLSFLVEASDPDGTIPVLSAATLPAGADFTDNKNGTGIFDWTPQSGQAGSYTVTFKASDGQLSDSAAMTIIVCPAWDTDCDGMADAWEIANFGDLSRDGTGDFDGDGISDLLEYLLGTNPVENDHAPTIPGIVSPVQGSPVTSLSPGLIIENSVDPDGDEIFYEYQVFKDPELTQKADENLHVPETATTTSWQATVNLEDNSWYYWRVRACDGRSCSLWNYGSFFVNLQNDPPAQMHVSYPAGNGSVDTQTPVLEVTNSHDPDGDTLTYAFEVYQDSGMTHPVASFDDVSEGENGITSVCVAAPLDDNAQYYWKATVSDGNGEAAELTSSFYVRTSNASPTAPGILQPAQNSEIDRRDITLEAAVSTDPENEDVHYLFELDTAPTFDSPVKRVSEAISGATVSAQWPVSGLADNTTYYWRVKAGDGASESLWSRGKFFVNTANDSPPCPEIRNPGDHAWVDTLTPGLVLAPVVEPDHDAVTYRVEIYSDALLKEKIYTKDVPESQPFLTFQLEDLHSYYWRAQSIDEHGTAGEWTPVFHFFVKDDGTEEDVSVQVSGDPGQGLAGLKVYAFTESGSYTGKSGVTDDQGVAVFNRDDFSPADYKFRIDWLGHQFWTQAIAIPEQVHAELTIDVETVQVTVSSRGAATPGVSVYLFSADGSYLNESRTADENGKVLFDLPAGADFMFRADVLGNQYLSPQTGIVGGGANTVSLDVGGGMFGLRIQEDAQTPLQGIKAYLFNANGSYLNLNRVSDEAGHVAFNVPEGTYKVRADWLGYPFWCADTFVSQDTEMDLTIPHHDVSVRVKGAFQAMDEPVEAVPVYLFTSSGSYMNVSQTTDAGGTVRFHLPEQPYKVRADWLGRQFWSEQFTAMDADIMIPMADARITVTGNGQPMAGVRVYLFSISGAYLNQYQTTDSQGNADFHLPAGPYKFRADYQGSQYWSAEQVLLADVGNPIEISTGGGTFELTVLKNQTDPLVGATCHLFSGEGTYLNLNGTTSSDGKVSFDVSDGEYKIRVDHLGYQFRTDVYTVPEVLSDTFIILHQDIKITLAGVYQGSSAPVEGIPLYLFTSNGGYLNQYRTTDGEGEVVFSLPDQPFKVRADWLGHQFWSDEIAGLDAVVEIPMARAEVTVTGAGALIGGVPVYVFSETGAYLNLHQTTGPDGKVLFSLPAKTYKFRTDCQGSQYWSGLEALAADQSHPIEINTGGGRLFLTVLQNETEPLVGAKCYLFNGQGAYLNQSGVTSSEGLVTFDLADGSYKIRVDHLGYQFWTNVYNIPGTLMEVFVIETKDVTVSVKGYYQAEVPLQGLKVYLFKPSGSYLNQCRTTDSDGKAVFRLPDQPYSVRADYLGYQFWSDPFQFEDATVRINQGTADVHVRRSGNDVQGAKVYLFSASGSYLNQYDYTDPFGIAEFLLPNRPYKFRVDEGGDQVYTPVLDVLAGQVNEVEINLDE